MIASIEDMRAAGAISSNSETRGPTGGRSQLAQYAA